MIDLGLAILVGFSPVCLVLLLLAALNGAFDFPVLSRHRLPPLTPFRFAACGDDRFEPGRPVLASDRERDEALAAISYAVGEGRLNLEEAGCRVDGVLQSRHRHELAALLADLPHAPVAKLDDPPSAPAPPARLGPLALAAVTLVAAVALQAATGIWELWPLAVATCAVWASRTRH